MEAAPLQVVPAPASAGLGGPLTGYVGPFSAGLVQQVPLLTGTDNFRSWWAGLRDAAAGADPTQFFEIPGGLNRGAHGEKRAHLLHECSGVKREMGQHKQTHPPCACDDTPAGQGQKLCRDM